MALLGFDGFEGIVTADLPLRYTVGSSPFVESGGVNGQRVTMDAGGDSVSVSFSSASEVIAGFQYRENGSRLSVENIGIFEFREASTPHVGISVTHTGNIRVTRGDSRDGVELGVSSTPIITASAWSYIEVRALISDTVGSVTVAVDGATVLSLTNIDTRNGGNGIIDSAALVRRNGFGNPTNSYDDFYWMDTTGPAPYNAFLGPIRVDRLAPSSDSSVQFTRSGGAANFEMVDDTAQDGDTSYNESGTAGHKDTFGLTDLSTPSGIVYAVQPRLVARRTDADAINIISSVISNAVEADGASKALGASYQEFRDIFTQNPDGNVAWNDAAVNALQVAYRIPV